MLAVLKRVKSSTEIYRWDKNGDEQPLLITVDATVWWNPGSPQSVTHPATEAEGDIDIHKLYINGDCISQKSTSILEFSDISTSEWRCIDNALYGEYLRQSIDWRDGTVGD